MAHGTSRGSMAAFLAEHLSDRLARRFWAKVDRRGPVPERYPELGPCWIWTRATDRKGYGRFGVGPAGSNRVFFAHRVAMALAGTVPPDDLMACHHCDNPPCCNPGHLFLGTGADNLGDMAAKGRNHGERCGNGHLMTPENTHIYHWGGYDLRRCRQCDRERVRAPSKRRWRPPAGSQCTKDGCTKPLAQKGMCWMHYLRERRASLRQQNSGNAG